MSREIILHHITTHQNLNDIIEDFYPEFCSPDKKPAILDAIAGMNAHNGNITGGVLSLNSWILLPAYSSSVYEYIVDKKDPSPGVCYAMATIPIYGIPHVTNTQSALHQGMKSFGPQKMLALAEFTHDWYHEFKENLAESPLKDLITGTGEKIAEKVGEHGASVYVATRSLDQALKKFGSAAGKEARQSAKQEALSAHKQVQHELPKVVKKIITHYADKKFTKPSERRGLKALISPGYALRSGTKFAGSETLTIGGSKYTKLLKIMRYGDFIAPGLLLIDVTVSTIKVVGAYEKGENWQELAFKEGGGIIGAIAGGWAGGLIGTTVSGSVCGPCAVIGAPVGAISGAILAEKAGEITGKAFYRANFE